MRSYLHALCLALLLAALQAMTATAQEQPAQADEQLAALPGKHAAVTDKEPAQDKDLAAAVVMAAAELEEFDPTIPAPEGAVIPEPEPAQTPQANPEPAMDEASEPRPENIREETQARESLSDTSHENIAAQPKQNDPITTTIDNMVAPPKRKKNFWGRIFGRRRRAAGKAAASGAVSEPVESRKTEAETGNEDKPEPSPEPVAQTQPSPLPEVEAEPAGPVESTLQETGLTGNATEPDAADADQAAVNAPGKQDTQVEQEVKAAPDEITPDTSPAEASSAGNTEAAEDTEDAIAKNTQDQAPAAKTATKDKPRRRRFLSRIFRTRRRTRSVAIADTEKTAQPEQQKKETAATEPEQSTPEPGRKRSRRGIFRTRAKQEKLKTVSGKQIPKASGEELKRIQELIRTIKLGGNYRKQSEAKNELISMGEVVAPEVVPLVDDIMPMVRVLGIIVLRETKSPIAYPVLYRLLRDQNGQIRYHAVMALRKMTGAHFGFYYDDITDNRVKAIKRWQAYLVEQKLLEEPKQAKRQKQEAQPRQTIWEQLKIASSRQKSMASTQKRKGPSLRERVSRSLQNLNPRKLKRKLPWNRDD